MTKQTRTRLTSYFFLLINTIVWGLALIIVKPSLEFTTPFRYLLYRYVIAALCSIPILLYYWPKVKNKIEAIKKVIFVEFFGTALTLGLLYVGLSKTTAIEASFLTTTTPIFVVLAGIFYLREKEEIHEWVGITTAFFGTLVLTMLPVIINGMSLKGLSLEGNLLIILQNVTYAIAMVLAKKHYKNLPKLFVTGISFYFGVAVFLLLSLIEIGTTNLNTSTVIGSEHISTIFAQFVQTVQADFTHQSVWLASIYMAIFGSIIGLTAYIKGQDGIEASEASLFSYLQPLVFVPAGILLLQETVHPLQIFAMVLILLGVYIAEKRSKKRRAKANT